MPNDMLTQAIANLEAVAAEMRTSRQAYSRVQPEFYTEVQCWADKVLTAVSDLKEVEAAGWQTIETAPQDGRRVLLYQADGQFCQVYIAFWDRFWRGDSYDMGPVHPTHWMPLPDPPAESQSSDGPVGK